MSKITLITLIPGASLRSPEGTFQFIPGVVTCQQFVAGQFIGENNDITFIHGEVVHTKAGAKFVEGETILTADGLKFVAGFMINETFIPGGRRLLRFFYDDKNFQKS